MKSDLEKKFNSEWRWVLIPSIIIALIWLPILLLSIIPLKEGDYDEFWFVFIISVVFYGIIFAAFFFRSKPFIKDRKLLAEDKYVRSKGRITRTIKIPGYRRAIVCPVFCEDDTGRNVVLDIDDYVEVGRKYTILYLPNTGCAVVEKYGNNRYKIKKMTIKNDH